MRTTTGLQRAKKAATWAAILSLGAVAACGASAGTKAVQAVTTANAVGDAFSGIRSQSGIKLTLSLGVTPDQLLQIGNDGGDTLTKALATSLSGTSVVINLHTGHGESLDQASANGASDKDSQAEISLLVKGETPVDIRVVDQNLFLKADVSQLLSLYGQDPAQASETIKGLSQMDAAVPGLSKLAGGGWVSISLTELSSLAARAVKPSATTLPSAKGGSLLNDIGAAFNRNQTVVNNGTHDGRTEYTIVAPVRQLAQDLISTLAKDSGTSASAMSAVTNELSSSLDSIPAGQRATVQLWVKDDKAQEIDFDLNQFANKYPFPVPLKIVIGDGSVVKAPSGATAIDLSPLAAMLTPPTA
jgi:hypothetical protein